MISLIPHLYMYDPSSVYTDVFVPAASQGETKISTGTFAQACPVVFGSQQHNWSARGTNRAVRFRNLAKCDLLQ